MGRIQEDPKIFRDGHLIAFLISAFCFKSRMKRSCTPLGRRLKFHVLLASMLLDTSTSDACQTEPGGKEMSNANVREGQALHDSPAE